MSPPKSQDSETRDQLDEDVWTTSPPLEDFSVKKLEPVIFPRSKQMGYPLGVSAVDTPKQKQTLHEFMWPHLHHLAQRLPLKPGIVEAKAEPTDVSPSILGQASSTAHMEDGDSDPMIMDLDDVDGTIEYIYRTVKGEDPAAIIMRERIDQVDALLLDVPFLPAPNVHPTVFNAPTKLKDLLAPPQHLPQKRGPLLPVELDDRLRPEKNRFALKKVIGVQSLNIELPWRPFIIGESTIPTLESITNIEGDIVAVEDQKAVEILLGKAVLKIAQQEDPSRKWLIGDLIYQHNSPRLRSPEPLMLSRAALRSARQVEQKDCPGIDAMISTNELQVESRRYRELIESRRNLNSALATTPLQLPSGVQTKNRSSTPLYRAQDSQEAEIATGAEEARRRIVDIQCPKSTPSSGLSQGNPLQEGPTLSYSSESKAPQRTQLQLAPSCATAHNQNRLKEFIGIRSKDIVHDKSSVPPSSPTVPPQADPPTLPIPPIATIPLELLSHVAYLLDAGNVGILPGTIHRYIASYDLLQKRGIVRNLMSREVCSAELIERENVVDVDLIIDAGAAVIFFALPALPVTANALIERLSTLSWRYSKILVVFESYPPSHSRLLEHGTAEPEFVPYAFGPPVLKSFKHLRRSLCISESTGSKNGACGIQFVFALGEVEAARYVRLFADHRIFECADDANKALSGQWDGREWLVEDIYEGEEDLAAFDGMNLFSAIAIVSTVNLTSVIEEMTPKERIELFSGTVGYDRMINFNRILHERSLAIASSPTPYVSSRHTSDGAKAFVPEFD
ncbi:hypothetical protein FRB93_004511 [Tulasnella sp. JGI-2019a]|nr:hypothetical protein FRB93_004511 [Tulasnella sp. JGI-2019a]